MAMNWAQPQESVQLQSSNYRGETEAKTLARIKLFDYVEGFKGDCLFMASAYGGDIQEALIRGIKPERIHAVDIDAKAAAECKRQFPQINIQHKDVVEYVTAEKNRGHYFGFVHLDFCGNITESTLRIIQRVAARGLWIGGALAITLLKGREFNSEFKGPNRQFRKAFKSAKINNAKDLIASWNRDRYALISCALTKGYSFKAWHEYFSGSPMMLGLWQRTGDGCLGKNCNHRHRKLLEA